MESLNIIFTGKNQVELRPERVPELGAGQILMETQCSLISTGTECICFARKFAPDTHWDHWVKYPFHPGYSNVGRVLQVAPDVKAFQSGDRVAVRAKHHQFHVANAEEVLLIPDEVTDEDATWFGIACIVQNGVRRAQHELGDTVVIVGLGLLGQLAVQYARLFGAQEVIAIDTAATRLEMANTHGATHTLRMSVDQAREEVWEITNGRGADVVYDVTGHPAVFPSALGLARRFGKLLLLGDAGVPSEQRLTMDVITRGVSILGAHDSDPPSKATDHLHWTKPYMAQLFFTYLQRGQMRVNDLVTHRFSPREADAAYSLLMTERERAMGVSFQWREL